MYHTLVSLFCKLYLMLFICLDTHVKASFLSVAVEVINTGKELVGCSWVCILGLGISDGLGRNALPIHRPHFEGYVQVFPAELVLSEYSKLDKGEKGNNIKKSQHPAATLQKRN